MGIQQFESQYSFRTGVVTVPAYRDQPAHTEWGIVFGLARRPLSPTRCAGRRHSIRVPRRRCRYV
jgi:hypothetical protein